MPSACGDAAARGTCAAATSCGPRRCCEYAAFLICRASQTLLHVHDHLHTHLSALALPADRLLSSQPAVPASAPTTTSTIQNSLQRKLHTPPQGDSHLAPGSLSTLPTRPASDRVFSP